jgi:hypothetical protein
LSLPQQSIELLSFEQFEREVTGDRIRDKIAASKKKGMWMGGVVPLGYEVRIAPSLLETLPTDWQNQHKVLGPYKEGRPPRNWQSENFWLILQNRQTFSSAHRHPSFHLIQNKPN